MSNVSWLSAIFLLLALSAAAIFLPSLLGAMGGMA